MRIVEEAQDTNEAARARNVLTYKEYRRLVQNADFKCQVCRTPETDGKTRLAVDHDHRTGEVRGVLCHRCNRGIGLLGDSVEGAEAALTYLMEQEYSLTPSIEERVAFLEREIGIGQEPVLVNFVLDETGSMAGRLDVTISTFNEYLDTLLNDKEHEYRFMLTRFDSEAINNTGIKRLEEIDRLNRDNYVPGAMTPLYDAVMQSLSRAEEAGYSRVFTVILTDGLENASKQYGQRQVSEKIQALTDRGWAFTYLGVDRDAWGQNVALGISDRHSTRSYTTTGLRFAGGYSGMSTTAYAATGKALTSEDVQNLIDEEESDDV